jgi:diacylglycerol kinase family enzyme
MCRAAQVKGDLLVVAAGNSRQMARMLAITPDAMLDDGLLDVTLLLGTITDQVGACYVLLEWRMPAWGGV